MDFRAGGLSLAVAASAILAGCGGGTGVTTTSSGDASSAGQFPSLEQAASQPAALREWKDQQVAAEQQACEISAGLDDPVTEVPVLEEPSTYSLEDVEGGIPDLQQPSGVADQPTAEEDLEVQDVVASCNDSLSAREAALDEVVSEAEDLLLASMAELQMSEALESGNQQWAECMELAGHGGFSTPDDAAASAIEQAESLGESSAESSAPATELATDMADVATEASEVAAEDDDTDVDEASADVIDAAQEILDNPAEDVGELMEPAEELATSLSEESDSDNELASEYQELEDATNAELQEFYVDAIQLAEELDGQYQELADDEKTLKSQDDLCIEQAIAPVYENHAMAFLTTPEGQQFTDLVEEIEAMQ